MESTNLYKGRNRMNCCSDMAETLEQSDESDAKPQDGKWKFPNSNRYHEYECVTVQVRSDNGFDDLIEVTDRRVKIENLKLCDNCEELKKSNDGDVEFSRDDRETSMSRVTVRIPEDNLQQVEQEAENGSFQNRCEVIREAIREFIER